jgi:hypothetical protein
MKSPSVHINHFSGIVHGMTRTLAQGNALKISERAFSETVSTIFERATDRGISHRRYRSISLPRRSRFRKSFMRIVSCSTRITSMRPGSRMGATLYGARNISILCRSSDPGRENCCQRLCPASPSRISGIPEWFGSVEANPWYVSKKGPTRLRSCAPLPVPPFADRNAWASYPTLSIN